MATVRVRGIDLYYEEYGSGPHLVVAHGLMGSVALAPRFGERVEEIAARGVHVIAYDARGHGRSGYTTRRVDYHWDSLAEDMHGIIDALGLGRASIYGGSMGAGTALMLALAHPNAVEKLILRVPPPFGDDIKRIQGQFAVLAMLFRLFGPAVTARMLGWLPQQRRMRREHPENDMRSFFAAQRRASIVPAIRGVVLDGVRLPVHRFAEIEHPTLVLTHPGDALHPLASGEILHERLTHAKLAVAPTQTYWQEQGDALTHVIASFVKGEQIARGLPEKVLHEHGV
ncbi:MAG: alpha/beta hydrolase [Chloroflexota bacterium]|nr:alpha/beta hydrolase [Chloroflexota bacterium]